MTVLVPALAAAAAGPPQVGPASRAGLPGACPVTVAATVFGVPGAFLFGSFSVYKYTFCSASTIIVPRDPITHSPYGSNPLVLIDEYVTTTTSLGSVPLFGPFGWFLPGNS